MRVEARVTNNRAYEAADRAIAAEWLSLFPTTPLKDFAYFATVTVVASILVGAWCGGGLGRLWYGASMLHRFKECCVPTSVCG